MNAWMLSFAFTVCLCISQAPYAFGCQTYRNVSTVCVIMNLSSKVPAACIMLLTGACFFRTSSSSSIMDCSWVVSHFASTTSAPARPSASSLSPKPWLSRVIFPERLQSTMHRPPASTKDSAVTTPRPPKPPVITHAPSKQSAGAFERVPGMSLGRVFCTYRARPSYRTSKFWSGKFSSVTSCDTTALALPAAPYASVCMYCKLLLNDTISSRTVRSKPNKPAVLSSAVPG
mmetsp:Transcript_29329/g.67515  ORF Transcript_29329/g.67515 Transcript_29329/m.67515 type:complete len:231 (+) Transcript_29329:757-1449(+)